MSDSLYAIAVLIDEIKHEDPQVRLNSIRRLQDIAKALGPERSRSELIPYLQEFVEDEEISLALAEELGNLVDLVGGQEHAGILMAPLESLAGVEENAVRDKAVESMCKVIDRLSPEAVSVSVVPVIQRMATGDWFSSKSSACGLFASIYQKSGVAKSQLRSIFSDLCQDETPMVRRAAASNLGKFAKKVEKEHIKGEFIHLLGKLAQDEQDSVRLLVIESCISMGELLSPEENSTYILPTIKICSGDKSWRVRYMVADRYADLSKTMGAEITKSELVPAFVKLLKDSEAEVKTAAAFKVTSFASALTPEVTTKQIIPCVRELAGDSSQHVRSALASVIVGLASHMNRSNVIDTLLPLILKLLKDESSEVRLNVISKLDAMNQSVGLDLLSQALLPAIVELAEDGHWRVRLAIIEQMPLLASLLGVRFFDEKFNNLCSAWLGDSVYSVREAAALNLKKLTETFGIEWARANIVPKLLLISQHPNYLFRVTSLHAVQVLYSAVTPDIVSGSLVPMLARLGTDPVPNIRFNVAKTVLALLPSMDASVVQQVKPIVGRMMDDTDRDVKYYGTQAYLKC